MVELKEEICIGCGMCVKDCIAKNLKLQNKKAKILGECFQCGHCVAVCPVNAVSIPDYEMEEVEEYNPSTFFISPQNFLNAVKFRRSIRDFKEKPVEREKLEHILKAGQYTETAVNYQDVKMIVVQDKLEKIKELVWEGWKNYGKAMKEKDPVAARNIEFFYQVHQKNPKMDRLFFNAPVLLVVASDIPLDGGLASANIETMAVAEGLGVLFDGYILHAIEHNPKAMEWLELGEKKIASCMLIGYPNVKYYRTAPRRKGNFIWK